MWNYSSKDSATGGQDDPPVGGPDLGHASRRRSRGAILGFSAIAILLVAALAGCSKIGEKVAEKTSEELAEQACADSGEDCEIDIGADGVNVSTPDGEISVDGSSGVSIGDGDASIELPDFLTIDAEAQSSVDTGGLATRVYDMDSPSAAADALDEIQTGATEAGCTVETQFEQAEVKTISLACDGGRAEVQAANSLLNISWLTDS